MLLPGGGPHGHPTALPRWGCDRFWLLALLEPPGSGAQPVPAAPDFPFGGNEMGGKSKVLGKTLALPRARLCPRGGSMRPRTGPGWLRVGVPSPPPGHPLRVQPAGAEPWLRALTPNRWGAAGSGGNPRFGRVKDGRRVGKVWWPREEANERPKLLYAAPELWGDGRIRAPASRWI